MSDLKPTKGSFVPPQSSLQHEQTQGTFASPQASQTMSTYLSDRDWIRLAETIRELQHQLSDEQNRRVSAEHILGLTRSELASAQREIRQLHLEGDQTILAQLETTVHERDSLRARILLLENQNHALRRDYDKVCLEMDHLRHSLDPETSNSEALQSAVRNLQTQVESLTTQTQREITEYQDALNAEKKRVVALLATKSSLRDRLSTVRGEYIASQVEMEQQASVHHREMTALETQVFQWQQTAAAATTQGQVQHSRANAELTLLKTQLLELQLGEGHSHDHSLHRVKTELEFLKKTNANLVEKVAQLEAALIAGVPLAASRRISGLEKQLRDETARNSISPN